MFTAAAFLGVILLAWLAGRQNEKDRPTYDRSAYDDKVWLIALHLRQDLKLVAFLLGGILVMLGVLADTRG